MRFHTYTKFSPELADAIDLQALLDKLADFLLQSGFAGGDSQSYYGFDGENEGNRSLDALKQAILDALMESGQFTPASAPCAQPWRVPGRSSRPA